MPQGSRKPKRGCSGNRSATGKLPVKLTIASQMADSDLCMNVRDRFSFRRTVTDLSIFCLTALLLVDVATDHQTHLVKSINANCIQKFIFLLNTELVIAVLLASTLH